MTPCPHCHHTYLHAPRCPSPHLLPAYAVRPAPPARCPDCSSLRPGVHRAVCPVRELGAGVIEVPVRGEGLEGAR
jgi:hypothetical protein